MRARGNQPLVRRVVSPPSAEFLRDHREGLPRQPLNHGVVGEPGVPVLTQVFHRAAQPFPAPTAEAPCDVCRVDGTSQQRRLSSAWRSLSRESARSAAAFMTRAPLTLGITSRRSPSEVARVTLTVSCRARVPPGIPERGLRGIAVVSMLHSDPNIGRRPCQGRGRIGTRGQSILPKEYHAPQRLGSPGAEGRGPRRSLPENAEVASTNKAGRSVIRAAPDACSQSQAAGHVLAGAAQHEERQGFQHRRDMAAEPVDERHVPIRVEDHARLRAKRSPVFGDGPRQAPPEGAS